MLSVKALREVLFPRGLPIWKDKNEPAGVHLSSPTGRVCLSGKRRKAEFIDGTRVMTAMSFLSFSFM